MPIQQEEFEEKVRRFRDIEEARSRFYNLALELLNQGHEIEAYILILATWNFARFRYILRNFNLDRFREIIQEINPIFENLRDKSFKDANFEDPHLCEEIKEIYEKLKEIVEQTGASKIMHLKNPNLFVMWDRGIRRMYGIRHVESEDYISFLRKLKKRFSDITWENRDQTLAKAIDEYNYVESQE